MSIESQIQALARKFEEESNESFNLWTWLPSYQAAQRAHGDYASEFQGSTADTMKEASMFIADKLKPSEEKLINNEFYCCPCGMCEESYGIKK